MELIQCSTHFFYQSLVTHAVKTTAKPTDDAIKCKVLFKEQVAKELYKTVIRKCDKLKVYFSFKDNICNADIADIQLISKYNY